MSAATITFEAAPTESRGGLRRILGFIKDAIIGSLLSTNPLTAFIVLGWLMRRMRWIAGIDKDRPGWLLGVGESFVARGAGGLVANVRAGFGAALSLLFVTLPFTALWSFAWWSGWENSFNKGYEQAAVGPLLSLLAIAISLPILCLLPMALAHRAAEGRWRAFLDWRRVRDLIARAGWRYVLLVPMTAVFALPVMLFRTVPLFIENIVPGFADMNSDETAQVSSMLTLGFAAYVFLALLVLRGMAARVYRRAVARLGDKPPVLALRLFGWLMMLAASFGFVVQIYVAQFFNHGWAKWFVHPMFLLPWAL
jgi:hypothetical protein